ncbi:hypothetical protein BABINDRAFT_41058 [Babjeviella inositovora NRRL Y-12698]|uniref:Uncharacterized protein n=1 Tax=Babjeviella inositovora NRRL Y-12698 TaxID=984486 RepID=A0A1E3QIU9_9ASCO|nr:uncharacterized protein BABINDRAFT_41058 [Babjeviella inositovora NRRL Y-12698]ODQ77626.1 hypothetical protein BABINDRAFT_41058 [Babjeviella inositovora NRRL Y-12698]
MFRHRLPSFTRGYSAVAYTDLLKSAKLNCSELLSKHDRSSFVLAHYVPEPARDCFLALRAFNLEIQKINNGGSNSKSVASRASNQLSNTLGFTTADIKLKFWSDLLDRIFQDPHNDKDSIGEPIAILIRDCLREELPLDISHFQTFLQTKKHNLRSNGFKTTDEICSYGEGTTSQLNYLLQAALLAPHISPSAIHLLEYSTGLQSKLSDIAAHLGQATAIGSMIIGTGYYAAMRNQVTLPVDAMTQSDLSQEHVLRLFQGHLTKEKQPEDYVSVREKLKEVVYQTAIIANDHLLTANTKLADVKEEIRAIVEENKGDKVLQNGWKRWSGGIPDALYLPFMIGIPTKLYLERLEKQGFDLLSPKLQTKEWKLAWRSYRNYAKRVI